ncbi:unnamed protein product [Rotaria magnacalcarata]|uniref:TIR domain-containing protein n=9 Tax=Rotaria magnacalcarata TaxID=392030 RepID=A0A816VKG8_9BILA|nr:unnamed protein product [Rotaria magnacalcarata]CAF2124102.1 unnamed protein product [Rotaria magnacalcarata]
MTLATTEFTDELILAVDQVCSPLYAQTFEKIAKEQPSSVPTAENVMIQHYPNQITWYNGSRRPEIVERIRRAQLKWFNSWLSEHNTGQPPYVKWSWIMKNMLLHVTNLLFRIDLGDIITTDEQRNDCRQIADTIKRILVSVSKSNPVTIDPDGLPLVQILLQILFYFTVDVELIIYLKSLQLVALLNVLLQTSNNDDEIHLHAYRILAIVMAEADIKQLQNSSRIATVFIKFITDTIDQGVRSEGRLHNSLRSLKALTQHDQIREELIKQKGDSLFLRCVLEDKFNPLQAKLPALEILLALTFNKDFAATLKDNTTFINHVRTLASSSQQELQLVATALIWKLEKEPEAAVQIVQEQTSLISSPTIAKKQYDIMISYSHNDKELCHRILNVLEKDQLRVWIDSRLMHGATFDAMAKAIENAEFVVMCMSDAYKQSAFCEMEASYAVKRRCHIIPLVMTANYKADGWLGVLTSALIHVDFPKLGFDKAYQELKKQIALFRMNDSNSTRVKHDSISLTDIVPKTIPTVEKKNEPRPVVEYPHCVDMWTKDHVKSFLLDKELDILIPAFEGMNGRLLHKVYNMCQTNEHAMFSSLKEEIAKSQLTTALSLKDYLIFLDEIKVYIPCKAGDQLNPTSAICNLM